MPRLRNRGRAGGAVSSRRSTRTSIRNVADPESDEEMQDAPPSEPEEAPPVEPEEAAGTPPAEEEIEDEEEPEFEVQKSPQERSASPQVQAIPKRRFGRWPRGGRGSRDGSEGGTPVRRKRGRPPGPGSRGGWSGRGSRVIHPPQASRVRIDKEGTMADVEDDEVVVAEDEEGEKKVDKDGHLQDGREYRVRTFTIMNRGKRLYMLSTEPARCCGFRDSYLFFTKHLQLYKVVIEEDEKRDLIDRDVIPHSYKGRSIGVVTARSVFREFGSRIVVGGKRITDDYKVAEARQRGDVEGELADPNDRLPPDGQPYNRNQYVAWHGASAVYHSNLPHIPIMNGKLPPVKRKIQITSANWQIEHARAASRFNSSLAQARKHVWAGVYDPHTNITHFPRATQPTHAKWSTVPAQASDLSPLIARNFLVVDTAYLAPPISGALPPASSASSSAAAAHLLGAGAGAADGMGLPMLDNETARALPDECRAALELAKRQEEEWRGQWSGEAADGLRAQLRIGFLGFPV